ncbi:MULTISPECIES: flagellar basal body L-ring protein FlgH [Marichromatium]|uniref:Flagellar L-ring protein n=1 Tax=Marichromatium gracile TaxID=1048 RepID=A0A4R4AA62_MARGR|nr:MULTISPECIES: flagellar basal body L-ring protein FlgH [Marichromatium]MBK1708152.1 flagellar basal body L-ring protein [Marichromatium gracile]MBO8087130.1 flagellar basal body L-ring protein FlgH [Marichromatium sp.]RNE94691.1 flagellar basal body L-ring protein FlgH [Marichromatium sp. AB32]TCW35833.1 flagellar L-ring protein precursor FlgH [Marichromatium gracile]
MNTRPLMTLALISSALSGCASLDPPRPGDSPEYQTVAPTTAAASAFNTGSIFQQGRAKTLFEDYKARRVGDILTVELAESTNAQKTAETSTSKDSGYSMDLGSVSIAGRPVTAGGASLFAAESNAGRTFDGAGDSKQSNQLTGSITVTVAQVLPNGNLVVQGEKWLGINQGQEYVRLRGIVRPVDISATNTVQSTQVANAQIYYGGTGALADSNGPGWLTRIANSPLFPF